MSKVINAVYEDGVFKPKENVDVAEHQEITLILVNESEIAAAAHCNLDEIIDIAETCADSDLSLDHDKHLYGEA